MSLCKYGCGREGTHQFKDGTWSCEKVRQRCPALIEKTKPEYVSVETRKKLSEAGKKRVITDELRRKLSESKMGEKNPQFGKSPSTETLKKRSKALKGKKRTKETRQRLREVNLGKKHSAETIKKMSESKKGEKNPNFGIKKSEETKRKISESQKGRKQPIEAVRKTAEALRGRPAWNKGKTGIYSIETRRQMRLSHLKIIEENLENGHQLVPYYNPFGCEIIDNLSEKFGYKFQHAQNGGEYRFEELGYWVDGFNKEHVHIIEIDEAHHFDSDGNLTERDILRQKEIEDYCIKKYGKCIFTRIKVIKDASGNQSMAV